MPIAVALTMFMEPPPSARRRARGCAAVVVVELRRVELAQVRHIRVVADDLASAEGDGPLERALWISCPMCLFSYPIGGTAVWMCS